MNVEQNLEEINSNINKSLESAENDTRPNVIAVTKYVTIERAKEAYDAGIRNFGENRLEGFQAKKEALPNDAIMHFIGTLQSRKVKEVIDNIDYLHALDRKSLAKEINKRATHTVNCFVQVNVSGEESKHGIALNEVNDFIEMLSQYENIRIVGLMTMAPFTEDEAQIRNVFKQLREKRDEINKLNLDYAPCTELSMGMSNDYEIATEEGATYVRIGTKLVGKEE
ncbi:YggS family pyridoxal phosphate-dependent enzyme [Staphylococcus condimenti]|uniref:Pyridoxal phosphate homeostasis protein n=1 Tax=Staphylococcus condimenti TaxID=70255 RepID=A0A143P9B3_9STAP|nr:MULTISPECIES: YggS family pyridoxal phosphate-dependent enzyme [Staphylococcus]AMY05026.1 YggS family pyridoxal phosphate enzyme [Staphylococcus condimenti]APR61274.1 YggS family pyridoxal phosphate enzyme [Staphylococcus condimenti]MDK8645126.1 YggS family pyridoxal phosphate-dependent enzyme [Staphylococcus condimenti]OFP02345.1 YggS family pyridoxal phosphate enzyme [Staphylococcus sp. HMSC065E08]PNZ61745.1 YggS family pyridoxal phosphate-dependent enzyme [Staphylococcus condimenti]